MIDKEKIRELLDDSRIFELLTAWGGEPQYNSTGILSSTICHNPPHEGSHKLYYYSNSKLFKCYTDCDATFDIYTLCAKVAKIQKNIDYSLYDSIRYIASFFHLENIELDEIEIKEILDSEYTKGNKNIEELNKVNFEVVLPIYDKAILDHFNYDISIKRWEQEGISRDIMKKAQIGYYPVDEQITIPHYDKNGNLIGIRGRALIQEDAEMYGKYRPLYINRQLYNHPLGLNLYGLNWNKNRIKQMGTAIVVEGEKSVLQFASYFGWDSNITVACCGSSISAYQLHLLQENNVNEVVFAFDRQFQKMSGDEYERFKDNLKKLKQRTCMNMLFSCLFDKKCEVIGYKDSPLDQGPDKFIKLYQERKLII